MCEGLILRFYSRLGVSLLVTGFLLGLANYIDVSRPDPCCDWIVYRGLPFSILVRGGFQGMHEYLWAGICADFVISLAIGGAAAAIWHRISMNLRPRSQLK